MGCIDFVLVNFEIGKYEISDVGFNFNDVMSEYVIEVLGVDFFVVIGFKIE